MRDLPDRDGKRGGAGLPRAGRLRPCGDRAAFAPAVPLESTSAKLARVEGILLMAREPIPSRKLAALADLADGTEARSLVADWARVGLTNRYMAMGLGQDLEAAIAQLRLPVQGVLLDRDWFAPLSSLQGLLAKLPRPA